MVTAVLCKLSGVLCRPHVLHASMREQHTTIQHAVCPQCTPYQPVRMLNLTVCQNRLTKKTVYILMSFKKWIAWVCRPIWLLCKTQACLKRHRFILCQTIKVHTIFSICRDASPLLRVVLTHLISPQPPSHNVAAMAGRGVICQISAQRKSSWNMMKLRKLLVGSTWSRFMIIMSAVDYWDVE